MSALVQQFNSVDKGVVVMTFNVSYRQFEYAGKDRQTGYDSWISPDLGQFVDVEFSSATGHVDVLRQLSQKRDVKWLAAHRGASPTNAVTSESGPGFARVAIEYVEGAKRWLHTAMVMDSRIV